MGSYKDQFLSTNSQKLENTKTPCQCVCRIDSSSFSVGSTPDNERSPIVLMSSSQADLDDWVRALRKVVGVPTNGGQYQAARRPAYCCVHIVNVV